MPAPSGPLSKSFRLLALLQEGSVHFSKADRALIAKDRVKRQLYLGPSPKKVSLLATDNKKERVIPTL